MSFAPGYRKPWDPLAVPEDTHQQATPNIPRSKVVSDKPWYHEHALLSAAAYDNAKYKDQYTALGYTVDPDLSQKSRTVFYNKARNKAVIAYKGTTPSLNPIHSDLAADLGILANVPKYLIGRFRGAEKVYNQTKKKYGKDNIEVTGHSLGGSQALYIGRKYGAKGTAFEPGVGLSDAYTKSTAGRLDDTMKAVGINRLYHHVENAMPQKKTSGIKIVASAYKPLNIKGFYTDMNPVHRAEAVFHQAEYGIAGLTRLPGLEERTRIKSRYKDPHTIKNFL